MNNKKRILYITRNGMLEPLGQSQVLSYLKGLSENYAVSLISFEKDYDLKNTESVSFVKKLCKDHEIKWMPQRFYFNPKGIAHVWNMIVFFFLCLREVLFHKAKLIHARSYIPAFVALFISKLTGVPFIFDMRALWPEEMLTSGKVVRGSMLHRLLIWVERKCLKNAEVVVSLTEAAASYLKNKYPDELQNKKIEVIPTCADLERFIPAKKVEAETNIYSCIGTVTSGWFRLDWLVNCFVAIAEQEPTAKFEIITRDDISQIKAAFDNKDELLSKVSIFSAQPYDIHKNVQAHTASVMFYAGGSDSELGRSPTRMAEILGCGLPVIASDGVGDVAAILEKYKVGIVVNNGDKQSMLTAFYSLKNLLADPTLPERCRTAAEEVYSLQTGIKAYRDIYMRILN